MATGRYRKILTRMHADDKFRQLSKPQPNGQSLWQYLLTGPHTTSIPGLFVVGEAALAEALAWPLSGLRRAWREIEDLGMAKADWKARVVWLPNAIRHNAPESPNVVKSWRDAIDQVPECELKTTALAQFEAFLEGKGQAFAKAFREVFKEGSSKPLLDPSPNQEQEQEQEVKTTAPRQAPLPTNLVFDHYHQAFLARYRAKPEYGREHGKYGGNFARMLKAHGADEVKRRIDAYFASADPFIANSGHPLGLFFSGDVQTKLVATMQRRSSFRVPGCRHTPPHTDAAACTAQSAAERKAIPA